MRFPTKNTLFIFLIFLQCAVIADQNTSQPWTYVEYNADKFQVQSEAPASQLNTVLGLVKKIGVEAEMAHRTRAQLVAVGLLINPRDAGLLKLNQSLEAAEFSLQNVQDHSAAINALSTIAIELYEKNREGLLARMLLEIGSNLDSKNGSIAYAWYQCQKHQSVAPWRSFLVLSGVPVINGQNTSEQQMVNAAGLSLKVRQSGINGLLISELPNGDMLGKASRMSATHLTRVDEGQLQKNQKQFRLRFNQEVGEMMQGTLGEIAGLMKTRHGDWIENGLVEFAFQDKFVLKDGDSAGLACSLMTESLVTGFEIDPRFSCTGSIRSDGSVKAIGGVLAKLRGAQKFGSSMIVLPNENKNALSDMVLLGKAADMVRMQVFTATTFEDAKALCRNDRSEEVDKAIGTFSNLQQQFSGGQILAVVSTDANRQKLEQILALTPNHASAEFLLKASRNKLPKTMSFNGSVEELISALLEMKSSIQTKKSKGKVYFNVSARPKPMIDATTRRVSGIKAIAHPKTAELAGLISKLNDMLRTREGFLAGPKPSSYQVGRKLIEIFETLDELTSDPEMHEVIDKDKLSVQEGQ